MVPTAGSPLRRRPVEARLADGTPLHAPPGVVLESDDRVCCHLCGRWFRSVSAHVPTHGWSLTRYRDELGIERGTRLEGRGTRARRAASFERRLRVEPALADGAAAGRESARAGHLAQHAAKAARGRRQPRQRLTKTAAARAAIDPRRQAAANRLRARAAIEATASLVLSRARPGSTPLDPAEALGRLVLDEVATGGSLAGLSRRYGVDKDWLQRHLPHLAPSVAATLPSVRTTPALARLDVTIRARGEEPRDHLARRRAQGESVRSIALDLRVSRSVVLRALSRNDGDGAGHPLEQRPA